MGQAPGATKSVLAAHTWRYLVNLTPFLQSMRKFHTKFVEDKIQKLPVDTSTQYTFWGDGLRLENYVKNR